MSIKAPAALLRAQWLANLTDTSVRIPLLNIRLGLDFLIGLIPGIGDLIMFLVALTIVWSGRQMGAPKHIQMAIVRNCLIDLLVGIVPVVGDLFDLFFKANQRNVRMLEKWWVAEHHSDIQNHAQQQLLDWQQHLNKE